MKKIKIEVTAFHDSVRATYVETSDRPNFTDEQEPNMEDAGPHGSAVVRLEMGGDPAAVREVWLRQREVGWWSLPSGQLDDLLAEPTNGELNPGDMGSVMDANDVGDPPTSIRVVLLVPVGTIVRVEMSDHVPAHVAM